MFWYGNAAHYVIYVQYNNGIEIDLVEYCFVDGVVLNLLSVCSIRHDFYGGCRDSAEGGRFCHA